MKKILLSFIVILAFTSLSANATSYNLALGKIKAVKIFDRSDTQYIQIDFADDATVYNSSCTQSGNTVAFITYSSHTSSIVNMWISTLMSAYETGSTLRISSSNSSNPCEVDMIALETTVL